MALDLLNSGDSRATTKAKMDAAFAEVGLPASGNTTEATATFNELVTDYLVDPLPGLTDGMDGGTARSRINAAITALNEGGGYDPVRALGDKLALYWDAGYPASVALSGSDVTAWSDRKAGVAATASGTPQYDGTGFNGGAQVTTDGVDDTFLFDANSLPSGAAPREIWCLFDCTEDPLSTSAGYIFSYGDGSTNRVRVGRIRSSEDNRARVTIGTSGGELTLTNEVVPIGGRHVVRVRMEATQTLLYVDDAEPVSVAAVPNTVTTRGRLFAGPTSTATNFWKGSGAAILVTNALLSDAEAAKLQDWLTDRAEGVVSLSNGTNTFLNGNEYQAQTSGYEDAIVRRPGGQIDVHVRQNDVWSGDEGKTPQRERAELRCDLTFSYGQELWGSMARKVVQSSAALSAGQMILAQIHTDNTILATSPILGSDLVNDGTWRIITRGGPDNTANTPAVERYRDTGFQYDRYYRDVFRVILSDTAGELDWWVDGVQVLSLAGVPIGYPDDPVPYWKFGIYRFTDTPDLRVSFKNVEFGVDSLFDRVANPLPL